MANTTSPIETPEADVPVWAHKGKHTLTISDGPSKGVYGDGAQDAVPEANPNERQ